MSFFFNKTYAIFRKSNATSKWISVGVEEKLKKEIWDAVIIDVVAW